MPTKRVKAGEEFMVGIVALGSKDALLLNCGERTMTIKPKDRDKYYGARGLRGTLLPRGWRKVDRIYTG
jgi:topoisomerase-4 subunit A